MTQTKLAIMLLKTWRQQEEQHLEAINALLKSLNGRESISQAESEKFEAEFDALEAHEKQQFNEAMAKAKAQGLIIH